MLKKNRTKKKKKSVGEGREQSGSDRAQQKIPPLCLPVLHAAREGRASEPTPRGLGGQILFENRCEHCRHTASF